MITLSEETAATFRRRLRGRLLFLGDPGFEESTRIWNGMISKTPALVVQPLDSADVLAAVDLQRQQLGVPWGERSKTAGSLSPTLDGRTLVHLWHILNLLEEAGGSVKFQGRVPPGWPAVDLEDPSGGIHFREADLKHLAKNGYIAITREAGGVTVTLGPRTRELVKSFRETIGKKAA